MPRGRAASSARAARRRADHREGAVRRRGPGDDLRIAEPARRAARTANGPLVTRLRDAGAIILGKTNVAELLFYQEGDNPLFGRTNNPWDLERTSGGGSGGEGAIIAAGGSPLGLAADIGGSIRTPAHFCGIQGLRPTSGRLTNLDSPPELFFPGMEAVILDPGPMARTVADLELAMRVLAAPGLEKIDPRIAPVPWPDPKAVSIEGLRIGVFEDDGYWPASPALRRAVREAAEILTSRGAIVEPFADPDPEAATRFYFSFLMADGLHWERRTPAGQPGRRQDQDGDADRACAGRAAPGRSQACSARSGGRRASRTGSAGRRSGRHAGTGASWRSAPIGAAGSSPRWTRKKLDAIVCPPHTVPAMRHGATRLLYDTPSYLMRFNVLGMPAGAVAATRVRAGRGDRPAAEPGRGRPRGAQDGGRQHRPARRRAGRRPPLARGRRARRDGGARGRSSRSAPTTRPARRSSR